MTTEHGRAPIQVDTMGEAEQLAVGLLRRAMSGGGGDAGLAPGADSRDALEQAASLLGRAACSSDRTTPGLEVAAPRDPEVTTDECQLLRALAAAQHHRRAVLDSALISLAPGRARRARLAVAVRALARALATSGRLLASPAMLRWSLPAAALTVARMHGYELGGAEISWPPRD